jgi:hypothetical protein
MLSFALDSGSGSDSNEMESDTGSLGNLVNAEEKRNGAENFL